MNETIEIWKSLDFIGYDNYAVSNLIRCKSLNYNRTGREKILKPTKCNTGYLSVMLYKDGKPKRFYIHRLVALAFIPNPYNLPEVNHKNEDKTDNRLSNLEWCTHKYNSNYGTTIERSSKARINGKCSKPVAQYTLDGTLIGMFPSAREASRQTGFSQGNISSCCRFELESAYGFVWRYLDSC